MTGNSFPTEGRGREEREGGAEDKEGMRDDGMVRREWRQEGMREKKQSIKAAEGRWSRK